MAPVTSEAIERKRARARAWYRRHPRKAPLPKNCVAEDEHWLVLFCESCFAYFDVKKGPGHRRPHTCDECRLGT